MIRSVIVAVSLPQGVFDIQNPYRLNSANGGLMRTDYAMGAGEKGVVNPFQPKPTGPVLPDRQMAAYGGIMGLDGRKQYGIGSWFQKAKDKVVDVAAVTVLIPSHNGSMPLTTIFELAVIPCADDVVRVTTLFALSLIHI